MSRLLVLGSIAFLSTLDVLHTSGSRAVADLRATIDSLVTRRAAEDSFSGVIAVARKGEIIYQRSVGLANRESRTPMSIDTKLQIASATKMFTQIAIRQLEASGKLSPTDTVGRFLPGYPNKTVRSKVTIEMLLSHRSGVGSFWNQRFMAQHASVRSVGDYMSLFQDDSLLFEPGTSQSYSNGGYVILGAIIERVSGQSYHDYLRTHIFHPAGMTETVPYDSRAVASNSAVGYTTQSLERPMTGDRRLAGVAQPVAAGATRMPNSSFQAGMSGPAGDHFSTVGDFIKLARALTSNRLLDSAHTAKVLGPRYAAGGEFRANGGGPGVNAEFSIYPSGDVVVVLSNYDPPAATAIAQFIRSLIGASPLQPSQPPATQRVQPQLDDTIRVSLSAPTEIPLDKIGDFYYVNVAVDGQPFRFTIETGANFFAVSGRLARALGLRIDTVATERGPTPTAHIDSLSIGRATLFGVNAVVTPLFESFPDTFDGIISAPVLRQFLATMDFPKRVLRLERGALASANGRDILPIVGLDRGQRVDVMLDFGTARTAAVLDTRSFIGLALPDSLEPRLSFVDSLRDAGSARGPSLGAFTLRRGQLRAPLRLGTFSADNPVVTLRSRGGSILGMPVLEQFAITFDVANGLVKFARPGRSTGFSVPEPPDLRRSATAPPGRLPLGFGLSPRPDGTLAIAALVPGANGERAGLRDGDRLIALDGVPAGQMNVGVFRAIGAKGTPVKVVVEREGKRIELVVRP